MNSREHSTELGSRRRQIRRKVGKAYPGWAPQGRLLRLLPAARLAAGFSV